MAAYAENKDRVIRKAAYLKKAEFMASIEDQIDEIYDQLVKVRDAMAKKMGYDNYVDFGYLRLKRSDYNSKDIEKYRDQVYREIVPIVNKLRQEQANRLEVEKLKEYDVSMFYKDINPRPIGSTNELVEKAYKMYSSISKETEEFFRYMKDNELLDLETKPGKRGGGYCAFIPEYNSPFIFSNFNKTSGDVDVLTHEAGHAFQVFTSSKFLNTFDLVWATLEACEIDSMSMEFFAHPYMDSFFGNQADKYRFMHLADSISFIPYGVSIDEFQHFVYENPDCGIKARKDKWHEIEKKYTPWRDYDGVKYYENGAYWQRQSHLFHTAFYYIDYTLAQVCAFYFYLSDLKDHETAWNKYYELCKLGGSKSFLNLLKTVGIPNPFIEGTLKSIMEPLIKRLEELKEKI
nr:M3 family oligoendopeptidase [Clostridia bacterium]